MFFLSGRKFIGGNVPEPLGLIMVTEIQNIPTVKQRHEELGISLKGCLIMRGFGEKTNESNGAFLESDFSAAEVKKAVFDMFPTKALGLGVAKALANRLGVVLKEVVSDTKSAFIPGRLISDNAIIGFECMHALQTCMNGKKGAMAIKLDMSKAYDRVE
ncbi:hypothetical protein Dsin_009296 [Dipteronia sinensis]|uniref:Reverse transcriptase n=1 Tax=Dipteronia sinensis TaxID=43782 RepID=A0AAE0AQD4_9ROSI|nr:hypothetical protein Dsin_009296 [Dipteronia sinensis]